MKIRMHRGSYVESLQTEQEIPASKEAIFKYITEQTTLHDLGGPEDIQVKFYSNTPHRQWAQDHIVLGKGSPYAFCSEPVTSD